MNFKFKCNDESPESAGECGLAAFAHSIPTDLYPTTPYSLRVLFSSCNMDCLLKSLTMNTLLQLLYKDTQLLTQLTGNRTSILY